MLAFSVSGVNGSVLTEFSLPKPQVVSGEEYYGAGYDDSMRRMPSVAKAERLLGFKARIPLDVALEESLSWFVGHYGTGLSSPA